MGCNRGRTYSAWATLDYRFVAGARAGQLRRLLSAPGDTGGNQEYRARQHADEAASDTTVICECGGDRRVSLGSVNE